MKKLYFIITVCLTYLYSNFCFGVNNSNLIPPYKPDSQVQMDGYSPDWVKTLIMTEVRIETLTSGGTFSNAIGVLDHFAETGVNGLWIDPIYERHRDDNNGYVNYGPHLFDANMTGVSGTEQQLAVIKNFVNEAHARNIRIFFDVIIWGTAKDSPLYSAHPDWYDGEAWGGYEFDTGNAAWAEWYCNQMTNLLVATGADGLRCDVEPSITGWWMFNAVRERCYSVGRKVAIFSEQPCPRTGDYEGVYDFEQNGVGYTQNNEWWQKLESGEYFISNNIVDTVKSGTAIGRPNSGTQGSYKFYTYNLDNHDSHYPISLGNIVRFAYQAILSPFIPIWFQGEEFYSRPHEAGILYFQPLDWSKKSETANAAYFDNVKKMIRIRRLYPDIFNYYPDDHRNSNICKINVSGNNLQAYARYANGRGVLVIPNFNDSANSYSFVPPYSDMGISGSTYKITDLLNNTFTTVSPSENVTVNIPAQNLAVLYVEDYVPDPIDPTSGAYWRFEKGTAGTAHSGHDDNWYIDSSGNENHLSAWGSEVNPTATSDVPFGSVPLTQATNTLALKFTGSQNISTASDSPLNAYTFPNGFTIECMVKYNDFNFGVAVCKEGKPFSSYDAPNFCIKHRGNGNHELQLQFFDGDGNLHDLRSNMTPNTGIWYRVAAVCNGIDTKLYIKEPNGNYELIAEELGSVSGTALYDDNQKWIVGRSVWAGNPTDYLNGYVDEIRITNVALNVSQFLGSESKPTSDDNDILFKDTFNVSSSGDINHDYNYSGRQSGPLAPLTYTVSGSTEVGNSSHPDVLVADQDAEFGINHNFTDAGKNFVVEFDARIIRPSSWANFLVNFGGTDATTEPTPSAWWFQGDGSNNGPQYKIYGENLIEDRYFFNNDVVENDIENEMCHIVCVMSTESYGGNDNVKTVMFANGEPTTGDNNLGRHGTLFITEDSFTNNYIKFRFRDGGDNSTFYIDNLTIRKNEPNFEVFNSWTDDTSSLISSANIYTHAVNLDYSGDITINGVAFTGAGTNPLQAGSDWTLLNYHNKAAMEFGTETVSTVSGNSANLVSDYAGSRMVTSLILSNLTPGIAYTLSLYNNSSGSTVDTYITPSDGKAAITNVVQGSSSATIYRYTYTAPSNGVFSICFNNMVDAAVGNDTWRLYAFSNEEYVIPECSLFLGFLTMTGLFIRKYHKLPKSIISFQLMVKS